MRYISVVQIAPECIEQCYEVREEVGPGSWVSIQKFDDIYRADAYAKFFAKYGSIGLLKKYYEKEEVKRPHPTTRSTQWTDSGKTYGSYNPMNPYED